MTGCVDSEPIKIIDTTSGFYYLQGTRITVEEPCFHCKEGEDSLRETVTFSVMVNRDSNNLERIQFYGLQGADTGDFDKRVFPNCIRTSDCEIFGTIQSSGEFEIDIENNGHYYQASGTIMRASFDDGRYWIELEGQYTYDDITIDYDLSGKKVSLTLD